jgi:AraC family transcriptional regulator
MASQRITILKDRRPKPTGFDLQFSTGGTPWTGFPIEEHLSPDRGSQHQWCYPKTHVVLNTQGRCDFRCKAGSMSEHLTLGQDTISVLPQGFEMTFSWNGPLRFMVVEIDPQVEARLMRPASERARGELIPQIRVTDPPLISLMRSMEAEAKSGSRSGRVYGESLSLAMLAYIESRFSSGCAPGAESHAASRLSHSQRQRLNEYVRAHLDTDLSLGDLASQVGLSPSYFCRVFKNSFGESPHQHLTKVRLEEARRLLADRDISIVEVADRVGFSSQSHLTAVFRRFFGVTPRTFRRRY